MREVDLRALAAVLVLSAVWRFITLAWRSDGGRLRLVDSIPAARKIDASPCAPCKGAGLQEVQVLPGNCRSSR